MKKSYNVLILSAGRRVELVQLFKKAATELSIISQIVAVDIDITAPALYFADKFFIIPRITSPEYINELIQLVKQEQIKLIIPTIDTELLVLAKNKELIEQSTDAKVMISNLDVIEICRDKKLTSEFLIDAGFSTPKVYDSIDETISFPTFIKPKSGSSSINAFKVNNPMELKAYMTIIDQPIIQEFVEGEEYTVDVFSDFNCKIITIVPRLRIQVRGGEIMKGKIVKNKDIIESVFRLVTKLNSIGHITVQLIKNKEGIFYIEINPRFGGGAPMSIMSGANSCKNLFLILMGSKLSYKEDYIDNQIYSRFDNSICID